MLKISRNRINEAASCGLEETDYYFKDWNDLSDELFYSSQVNMSPSTSAVSSSWSFVPSPLTTATLNGVESFSPDMIHTTFESKPPPPPPPPSILPLNNHPQEQQQKPNSFKTIEEREEQIVEEDEFEIIKHNGKRSASKSSSQFVIVLDEGSIERYSNLFETIQDRGHVDGSTVKTIWNKSCLPKEILYQIWCECEPVDGLLDKDSFIIGMGKIDTILEQYKTYNLLL